MKIVLIIIAIIMIAIGIIYLFPQINFREMPKRLIDGHLPKGKNNWVSSMAAPTDSHYIVPLKVQSLAQLSACIASKLPEVTIKTSDASKIIAYRPSPVFHFVDWLYIHADGSVSSSATMGSYDYGKNRELVERIRALCSIF
jgi:uncharacterized protein (DUF1499 family)